MRCCRRRGRKHVRFQRPIPRRLDQLSHAGTERGSDRVGPRPTTSMKILIVSQYFWPEGFRINEVAESLCRMGCEVTVLTGAPNYPDGKVYDGYSALSLRTQQRGEVRIQRVPVLPRGRGRALRLALNYLSFAVA